MIKAVKKIYWKFLNSEEAFLYLNAVLMRIPGGGGIKLRALIYGQFFFALGRNVSISRFSRFTGFRQLKVGRNVVISKNIFIQASGGVTIGNNVVLDSDVKIWSINHNFDRIDVPIFRQGHTHAEVNIEDDVIINENVFVMPGVHLPHGCVVMASSVVNAKKYPPFSILAGYPCRVIGMRSPKPLPNA